MKTVIASILLGVGVLSLAACGDDTETEDDGDGTCSAETQCHNNDFWDGYDEGYDTRGFELLDQAALDGYIELGGVRFVLDPDEEANEWAIESVNIATETGYVCETSTIGGGDLVQINCRKDTP